MVGKLRHGARDLSYFFLEVTPHARDLRRFFPEFAVVGLNGVGVERRERRGESGEERVPMCGSVAVASGAGGHSAGRVTTRRTPET